MRTLAIERMGDEVQGIRLRGTRGCGPEPTHVRIVFPGGDVDVARCDDGSYWIHVRVDSEADVRAESADHAGKLVDARLDIRGKHASECDAGDFGHPELYHLAVRVKVAP
jgi:hypothetical protein